MAIICKPRIAVDLSTIKNSNPFITNTLHFIIIDKIKHANFMQKSYIYAILLYSIFNCSCHNNNISPYSEGTGKKTQQLVEKYSVIIDSFKLYTTFSEEDFGNYTSYYTCNDTTFLVLENCSNSHFNIFNLTDHSTVEVKDPKLKCGQSHNMFFVTHKFFYKLEDNGELLEFNNGEYKLLNNFILDYQLKELGLWPGGLLDYSNEIKLLRDSTILFPLDINPDLKHKTFSKYDYGYPITGVFNITNRKITYEGISYPKFLFKNNYGLFTKIEQHYTDNYIYYSFVPLPEIWRYDRIKKTVDRFLVKSTYDTLATPVLNFKRTPKTKDRVFQHFKVSPHYKHLIYNSDQHLFYRFYALPLPEKTDDGLYTTYKDRKYSVMILDKEFNLLSEYLLPDDCFFIYFAIPTKDGLCINYGPFINSNKNGIKVLRINLANYN